MNYTDRVEVCVEVLHETDRAFKVAAVDEKIGVWLPKSQINHSPDPSPGDTIVFDLPEWLAYDKGLI